MSDGMRTILQGGEVHGCSTAVCKGLISVRISNITVYKDLDTWYKQT